MLALLLAACGNGGTGTGGDTDTGTGAGTTPTPASGGAGAGGEQTATSGNAGASGDKTITIGSKDFTEQVILGELYAQALKAKGYKVNRKLNLGSVQVLDKALQSGDIDMYPEYTGTTLETLLKYEGKAPDSPEKTYELVEEYYKKRNPPMALLESANFNNTNAIVVRKEIADQYKLKTLEDLAKASPKLTFASFSEFQKRTDSFPNMKKNYPEFNFKKVTIANDIGLRYKALQDKTADVGIGFTTDGQIAEQGLVVMEDPKDIWPFYYPTPVIREEFLKSHPDVEEIINSVSEKLNAKNMSEMNAAVDIEKEEAADVAANFLEENGLK